MIAVIVAITMITVVPIVAPVVVTAVIAPIVVVASEAPMVIVTSIGIMIAPDIMTPIVVAIEVVIARHVHVVVPVITHEIHAACAGMIFRTMLRPVALVPGSYMQVDWRPHIPRGGLDEHGLGIDERGWCGQVADT